jgi:hypothetical protein
MKQAIVDKSHSVSSNALVSSLVSCDGGLRWHDSKFPSSVLGMEFAPRPSKMFPQPSF